MLAQLDPLAKTLMEAQCIACHGVGREGLMMKAIAMRLFHLGLDAHVVGDMTTPALASRDVLFVSAGPGHFATISAMVGIARRASACVICITAEPNGEVPQASNLVIHLPAQTMATDKGLSTSSVLPMGSFFEGLMFLFFELLVLEMQTRLDVSPEAMRSCHTNLE